MRGVVGRAALRSRLLAMSQGQNNGKCKAVSRAHPLEMCVHINTFRLSIGKQVCKCKLINQTYTIGST